MLRIGICGVEDNTGLLNHLLKSFGEYETTGCFDPDENKAMVFARKHRIVAYRSLENLFPYSDIIMLSERYLDASLAAESAIRHCKHLIISENQNIPNHVLQRLQIGRAHV